MVFRTFIFCGLLQGNHYLKNINLRFWFYYNTICTKSLEERTWKEKEVVLVNQDVLDQQLCIKRLLYQQAVNEYHASKTLAFWIDSVNNYLEGESFFSFFLYNCVSFFLCFLPFWLSSNFSVYPQMNNCTMLQTRSSFYYTKYVEWLRRKAAHSSVLCVFFFMCMFP